MKPFTAVLFFLLSLTGITLAQEDGIAKYFESQINNENFSHSYISPRMISAVIKMDIEDMDDEMKAIIKDLKGMRILSSQDEGRKHFAEFVKLLDTKGYETIVSSRKPAESVKIYLKNEDKPDGEILMVFFSNDVCSMTSINGRINLDRIAKLSRQLNIKGAEYLENVKREQK
jgi:hypothetical protein